MNEYDELILIGRCKQLRDSILALYNDDNGYAFATMVNLGILKENDLKILFNGDNPYFQNAVKPPLGITPREIIDNERLKEIEAWIQRCIEAGENIPVAWMEELCEITNRMKQKSLKREEATRVLNATYGVKSVRNYESHIGNKGVK